MNLGQDILDELSKGRSLLKKFGEVTLDQEGGSHSGSI